MKLLRKLLTAAAISLCLATVAFADEIYIPEPTTTKTGGMYIFAALLALLCVAAAIILIRLLKPKK